MGGGVAHAALPLAAVTASLKGKLDGGEVDPFFNSGRGHPGRRAGQVV